VASFAAPFKRGLRPINHQRARADGAFAILRCRCTINASFRWWPSVFQGHSLTDPLRETVAPKTSRPDKAIAAPGGNPEVLVTKPTKPAGPASRDQPQRLDRDEQEEGAEPSAVFGEVETIDKIAPTMLALLQELPSGTRVYLRVKRTPH
jgi:hypothetical protein